MKKNLFSKILVGIFTVTAFSSVTLAEGGARGERFLECFEREYQPSAEQMKQIRAMHEKSSDWHELKEKMRESRKSLHEAMKSDVSEAELRRRFNEVKELKGQIQEKHFEKMLKLRSILTPEQRQKMGICGGERWKHGKHGRDHQ